MGTAGIKECSGGGLRVLTAPGCLSLMDILGSLLSFIFEI